MWIRKSGLGFNHQHEELHCCWACQVSFDFILPRVSEQRIFPTNSFTGGGMFASRAQIQDNANPLSTGAIRLLGAAPPDTPEQ
jgi:hypothetical protein